MLKHRLPLLSVVVAALGSSAFAEHGAIMRTDLVHHEMSIKAQEALQVRINFKRGTVSARTHSGEDVAHVLKGSLQYLRQADCHSFQKENDCAAERTAYVLSTRLEIKELR